MLTHAVVFTKCTKIQNTNTHRDSIPASPRQNIVKVEQYRFVLTTFGGLVVLSGHHKFFFSLSEKHFDHKKTTFTGWLQGHPQYQSKAVTLGFNAILKYFY